MTTMLLLIQLYLVLGATLKIVRYTSVYVECDCRVSSIIFWRLMRSAFEYNNTLNAQLAKHDKEGVREPRTRDVMAVEAGRLRDAMQAFL